MQLLSVATPALMSSLLKPNKRAAPRSGGSRRNDDEGEEKKEAMEEEKEKEEGKGEGEEELEEEEEAEHIQFLKQVSISTLSPVYWRGQTGRESRNLMGMHRGISFCLPGPLFPGLTGPVEYEPACV